jgi:hypothetical protein
VHPTIATVSNALGVLAAWAIVSGVLILVGPKRARHEAEADEFERILEAVAWPPGKEPSERVAV